MSCKPHASSLQPPYGQGTSPLPALLLQMQDQAGTGFPKAIKHHLVKKWFSCQGYFSASLIPREWFAGMPIPGLHCSRRHWHRRAAGRATENYFGMHTGRVAEISAKAAPCKFWGLDLLAKVDFWRGFCFFFFFLACSHILWLCIFYIFFTTLLTSWRDHTESISGTNMNSPTLLFTYLNSAGAA